MNLKHLMMVLLNKDALIFREAMINFADDAELDLGTDYNERKLIKKFKSH